MTNEIVSKKTRQEFREYFVGTTLREIANAFDAADVPVDQNYNPPMGGERRCLVEQYYHTVDWSKWEDVKRVLSVFENVLAELEIRSAEDSTWGAESKKSFTALSKWLKKDGFDYKDGRLMAGKRELHLHDMATAAKRVDAPELQRQIERMRGAVEDDPGLAIGTAKELIETTCKTILEDRNEKIDPAWDLTRLVKETRSTLNLVPESIPDSAKGADAAKRIVSNLGAVAQGLAELRNLYGTGHGRLGRGGGPEPRHARLAVGVAATLATFLLETHEGR